MITKRHTIKKRFTRANRFTMRTVVAEPMASSGREPDSALAQRLREAVLAGRLNWSGRRLQPEFPSVSARGSVAIAELISEDRGR